MHYRLPAAFVTASLFALAACGGEEAEAPAQTEAETEAAAETTTATEDAPAADAPETTEPAEESGLGEFTESVRTVECKVYDPGGDFEGPCEFTQWGGPSFTLTRADGSAFFADITEVVVEVDAPGIAGGSIRQNGDLMPIGTMTRHEDDKACWSSEDFTACAY